MYQVKSQGKFLTFHKILKQDSGTRHIDQPVLLGTGMKVHAYTRSKHMVDFFHTSGLCVDYSRILLIEYFAQATIQNMKKTGGVFVPPDDQNKALNVQICRKKGEVKTLTKTAELRKDRRLMIRPDINIEYVISVHEFSCIPRPLFASTGSMLPYMDKSKLFLILRAFV